MLPTAVVSYLVSKTGMNALTVEMQKTEDAREGEEKLNFMLQIRAIVRRPLMGIGGRRILKTGRRWWLG